jgi:hypothetical protein
MLTYAEATIRELARQMKEAADELDSGIVADIVRHAADDIQEAVTKGRLIGDLARARSDPT